MKKFYVASNEIMMASIGCVLCGTIGILYGILKNNIALIIISLVIILFVIVCSITRKSDFVFVDGCKDIMLGNYVGMIKKKFSFNDLRSIHQICSNGSRAGYNYILLNFSDKSIDLMRFGIEHHRTYRKEAIILICNDKWDKKRNKIVFGEIKGICDSLIKQIPGIELLSVD